MSMNKKHYMIELKELGDERGSLVVLEENKEFPFPIRRVFYDFNTDPTISRGNHANKESRFGFISLQGSCVVEVDDGFQKTEYTLNSPFQCLFVDKLLWKSMKYFTADNILLILSDKTYSSDEYIYDYYSFTRELRQLKANEN